MFKKQKSDFWDFLNETILASDIEHDYKDEYDYLKNECKNLNDELKKSELLTLFFNLPIYKEIEKSSLFNIIDKFFNSLEKHNKLFIEKHVKNENSEDRPEIDIKTIFGEGIKIALTQQTKSELTFESFSINYSRENLKKIIISINENTSIKNKDSKVLDSYIRSIHSIAKDVFDMDMDKVYFTLNELALSIFHPFIFPQIYKFNFYKSEIKEKFNLKNSIGHSHYNKLSSIHEQYNNIRDNIFSSEIKIIITNLMEYIGQELKLSKDSPSLDYLFEYESYLLTDHFNQLNRAYNKEINSVKKALLKRKVDSHYKYNHFKMRHLALIEDINYDFFDVFFIDIIYLYPKKFNDVTKLGIYTNIMSYIDNLSIDNYSIENLNAFLDFVKPSQQFLLSSNQTNTLSLTSN